MSGHQWVSLLLSVFLVLFAISGLVLNHRTAVAGLQISRRWLPRSFRYRNWNNAAVRGAVSIGGGEVLLYGGIGVWLAREDFSGLRPYNEGLPGGADHRRIERVFRTAAGTVLAATRYGLYRMEIARDGWTRVPLPTREQHVVDMAQKGRTLYVVTRSHILTGPADDLDALRPITLSEPPDWDGKVGLFRLVWYFHGGKLFGLPGRVMVDLLGICVIVLVLLGGVLFGGPRWMRFRKRLGKRVAASATLVRWCRRRHRQLGVGLVLLLVACTVSGMLLRPPFLLAIIRSRVAPWPGTTLHGVGPWHDRLRRLLYDPETDRFVLSTADGFFLFDGSLTSVPQQPAWQPPASVMGVTVLELHGPGRYLVGSFLGLYLWSPDKGVVLDWITKGPPPGGPSRMPFGKHTVSGYVTTPDGVETVFDYHNGARSIGRKVTFPPMPAAARNSPMSLWNLALEMHTGRLYQVFPELLRLLWIALSGLAVLAILLSGTLWWWRTRRRPGMASRSASSASP